LALQRQHHLGTNEIEREAQMAHKKDTKGPENIPVLDLSWTEMWNVLECQEMSSVMIWEIIVRDIRNLSRLQAELLNTGVCLSQKGRGKPWRTTASEIGGWPIFWQSRTRQTLSHFTLKLKTDYSEGWMYKCIRTLPLVPWMSCMFNRTCSEITLLCWLDLIRMISESV
jgi:hypothetical protein